jgi:hypothetical protein
VQFSIDVFLCIAQNSPVLVSGKTRMRSLSTVWWAVLACAVSTSPAAAQVAAGKSDLETGQRSASAAAVAMPPVNTEAWRAERTPVLEAFNILPAADVPGGYADAPVEWSYTPADFYHNVTRIPWETAAIVGGTLALGFSDWDWGTAKFHFVDEGFFGTDTHNGGMDKLGHAYGTMVLSDFFTASLERRHINQHSAALTGSIMGWSVMAMVETFDGFSKDYGFSAQDIVANTVGAAFSYLRNTVPGVQEKLDYRLEYVPSGYDEGFNPHSDYAGQKYILALKLAGFEQFEETPLRFLELDLGYFTEGFKQNEAKDRGISPTRHVFVAVGLNVEQILFGYQEEGESFAERAARAALQRVQIPYTYLTFDRDAYNS